MKKLLMLVLSVVFAAGLCGTVIAGSIDSPGLPTAGSGMYTLQNLYDYLTSGTALTVQSSFQEPTSGPTAGTMKTTKQIGDAIKALLDQSTATADEVKAGERFFCTQPGNWGIQTGTAQLVPTPTPTSTPTTTPTLTPTTTPTIWDETACLAKGGYWGPTQLDAPNDMGCWFLTTNGYQSCTDRCIAIGGGVACVIAEYPHWHDTDSCGAFLALGAPCGQCISSGHDGQAPWRFTGQCMPDAPTAALTGQEHCDRAGAGSYPGAQRLCLCKP